MHTTARSGWRIHFNSDLSGKAILQADDNKQFDLKRVEGQNLLGLSVEFPAELLLEFQARALEEAADEWPEVGAATSSWLEERATTTRNRVNEPSVAVLRDFWVEAATASVVEPWDVDLARAARDAANRLLEAVQKAK